MERAVDRDHVQIELDDPVERNEGFDGELVEHAGIDPLVATRVPCGVKDLEVHFRFDIDPRRSGSRPQLDRGYGPVISLADTSAGFAIVATSSSVNMLEERLRVLITTELRERLERGAASRGISGEPRRRVGSRQPCAFTVGD